MVIATREQETEDFGKTKCRIKLPPCRAPASPSIKMLGTASHFSAHPARPIFRRGHDGRRRGTSRRGRKAPRLQRGQDIADLFKFRYRIGLDVAMEALRDGLKAGRATRDDIVRYARVCRVAKVMQLTSKGEALL